MTRVEKFCHNSNQYAIAGFFSDIDMKCSISWESLGGSPPPPGTTGLCHLAILYPTRAELADALTRVIKAGITLDGASDHGVSEALYLRDPDQNGVELYWDRPRQHWPHSPDGRLIMFTRALELESLLAELSNKL